MQHGVTLKKVTVIVYFYCQATCLKTSVLYSRVYFNVNGYSKTVQKLRCSF